MLKVKNNICNLNIGTYVHIQAVNSQGQETAKGGKTRRRIEKLWKILVLICYLKVVGADHEAQTVNGVFSKPLFQIDFLHLSYFLKRIKTFF